MQKWLNDLYAILLKRGFDPGSTPTPEPTPEPEPYSNIYHGKYLGDTYTDEQKQAIANGSFDGLNIGDYWTINGINWRIADVDYYYNVGEFAFTKHHIVVVPDTILDRRQMNTSDDTSHCYIGSTMHTRNLDDAKNMFNNAFGSSFIPTHTGRYAERSNNGVPSNDGWEDMSVELMSEEQVFGHAVWGVGSQNGYDVGSQKTQFRLFSLDPSKINIRETYWLSNIQSTTSYSLMFSSGYALYDKATKTWGVRPFACIIGDPEQ